MPSATRPVVQEQRAIGDSGVSLQEVQACSDWLITHYRRGALLWLGVQTISVDSLLDLASNLNQGTFLIPLTVCNVFYDMNNV